MRTSKTQAEPRFAYAVSAVLFLAACAYIGAGLFGEMAPGLRTAPVTAVTVRDSVTLRGVAVRREQLVCSRQGQLLAESGQRVPAGGAIAQAGGETLTAPASALFFPDWDGLERLGPDRLEALTVKGLRELLQEEPEPARDAVGRLVLDYDWYYAALAAEDARLPALGSCRLIFEGMKRPVRAELVSVSAPEGGEVALLFRLTEAGGDYLSLRETEAALLSPEEPG